ncbi:MAG TPA: PPC domain-containing protein [Gemmataceae bacterium]|nr:PPC domain-containing protein [Gemmataceae bacterium]
MPKQLLYAVAAVWLLTPALWAQEKKEDPPKEKQSKKIDEAWIRQVQKLPADKQVVAVIGKLKEFNPGFDGKYAHKIENGAVTELHFVSDAVTDISPVRALRQLKALSCNGSGPGKGKVADLTPLKGLPLTSITVAWTQVSNLSPLKGMALNWFSCGGTRVTDLSPLKGMPITQFYCQGLDPSLDLLRSLKGLQTVNHRPAAEVMRQLAAFQPDPKKLLSVAGALTAKDPSDRMRLGCYHKVHKVELKADTKYIIDLMQAFSNIDLYLRLEDADGTQLAEDDDGGGQPNAALVFTPTKTATYRLIVTTCNQGHTGKYLLEAQPYDGANRPPGRLLNAPKGPIDQGNFNTSLSDTSPLDPNPEHKGFRHMVWTYRMDKGKRYLIGLNSGSFLPYLRLEDAAGNELAKDFTLDGFEHTAIAYTAQKTGTYRIVVSSTDAGGTGFFSSYVRPMDPAESVAVKSIRSLTPSGTLTKDDKMDPLREGRHYKVHPFKATAGKKYAITMFTPAPGAGNEFGGYMRLEDEDGTMLKKDEDPDDVERPMMVFRAEKTGMVKLVASSVEKGKTGAYNLQIRPLGPTDAEPKKQYNSIQGQTYQMFKKDPEDKVRKGSRHKVIPVRMKAGLRYVVDVTGRKQDNQPLDLCLRLEDSAGKILAQDNLDEGNDDPRIIFRPETTATYYLVVVTEKPVAAELPDYYGHCTLHVRPLASGESPPPPPSASGYFPQPPPPPRLLDKYAIVITPPSMPGTNFGGSNEESHGYVEYRFAIENRSETETRRVQLTMPRHRRMGMGWGHYLQAIKRSVEVAPKTTATLSLFQPDLALASGTDVEVAIDGQVFDLGISLSRGNRGQRFSSMHGGGGPRNNMLHILAAGNQAQSLDNNVFKSATVSPRTKRRSSGMRGSYNVIHQFLGLPLEGQNWSTSWLGYTAYDGVVLTGRQLKDISPEIKNALWQYVECGGSFLLIGNGDLPESWERYKVKGKDWSQYYPGFGQCLVFPDTRIRALTPEQWGLIVDMWDHGDRPWDRVRSPSEAQRDFPVVENVSIPVRSLFVVMLLFAILIGPVNIRVLTRKKRRIWLLWTVPAFSLLTCLLIVGFMFLSEGWRATARVGGMVFLDETSQRASSLSWLGLYTPMTPGDGLHFSQETEITPHVRNDSRYITRYPRTMDWTNDQHLDSGWISPRLPAHFMVRTGEKRLERLLVRQGNDGPVVTNGLKAPLKALWLADKKGVIYVANDIPEGGEAVLKRTDRKLKNNPAALRKLFAEDWFKLAGMCELPANQEQFLRPGCYLAILDGAPFMEKGVSDVQLRPEPTAVFGIMREPLAGSN